MPTQVKPKRTEEQIVADMKADLAERELRLAKRQDPRIEKIDDAIVALVEFENAPENTSNEDGSTVFGEAVTDLQRLHMRLVKEASAGR